MASISHRVENVLTLSLSATTFSIPFASGLWSAMAASAGARNQISNSSSVVRMTGMAFVWIGATTEFGSVVRNA